MKKILITALRFYRGWISPALPGSCRFAPSCSVYAQVAIERHGAFRGTTLTAGRILRCHPFNPGGYDPVPGKMENFKFQISNFKLDPDTTRDLESGVWNSSETDLTTQRNEHHG